MIDKETFIAVTLTALALPCIYLVKQYYFANTQKEYVAVNIDNEINIESYKYIVQQFAVEKMNSWLSTSQIQQHKKLYEGYVAKRNEITEKLQTIDLSQKGSKTYSEYRALKVAETYAVNGSLLHELYFENIGNNNQSIGTYMSKMILESFGSIDRFKKDFILSASCARGWVVTAFGLDDRKIHTYVLEEHNQNVPILSIPLLVLDVYEHAYMIDYGIDKQPYFEKFFNTINWNVVEQRIKKWIYPFVKE